MPQSFSHRMKMGTRKRKPQDFLSAGGPSPLKTLIGAGASALFDVRQMDGTQIPTLEPRTLPNGVRNGLYLQKVSFDYVLQASDVATILGTQPTCVWVGITKKADDILVGNPSTNLATSQTRVVNGYEPWNTHLSPPVGKYVNYNATQWGISFPLGTTLVQAQALLAGTVIRYQLATPIDRLNSPLPLTKFDTSVTLPNGVRNSEYVKRVSDEYVFENLTWTVSVEETANYWSVTTAGLSGIYRGSGTINWASINGYPGVGVTVSGDYASVNDFKWLLTGVADTPSFRFKIPKSEVVGTIDSNKAKAWFAKNGTKIRYQLATPIDLTALPAKSVYKDLANGVGENLFDPAQKLLPLWTSETVSYLSDGIRITTPNDRYGVGIEKNFTVPKNTDFTIASTITLVSGSFPAAYGMRIKFINTNTFTSFSSTSLTFNTGENTEIQILFYGGIPNNTGATNVVDFTNIQLIKGSAVKAYKPYIPHSAVIANSANTSTDGLVLLPIKSSKGRKIRYRNEVVNPLFWDTDGNGEPNGWGSDFNTKSVSNNTFMATASAAGQNITLPGVTRVVGKRYFYKLDVKASSNLVRINNGLSLYPHSGSGKFESIHYLANSASVSNPHYGLYDDRTSAWNEIQMMNPLGFCLDDNADILAFEADLGRALTAAEVNELFDFTADEGETTVALLPFRKFDGTDTVMTLGADAFNPLETEDFAVGFVLRLPAFVNQYLIARNAGSPNVPDQQISLYMNSSGSLSLEYGGTARTLINLTSEHLSTTLKLVFGRFNGKLKLYLNGALVYTLDNNLPLVNNALLRLFATANNATGSTHSYFSNAFSSIVMLAAPHTRIDEVMLLDAFDDYVADYFPTPRAVKDSDCVLYLDPRYEGEALRTATLEARTLPNGVANGPWTQRVSEDLVLNGSEDWNLLGTLSEVNTICFVLPTVPGQLFGAAFNHIVSSYFQTKTSLYSNDEEGIMTGGNVGDGVRIKISRSKLTTQNVSGFKAWLKQNPVTIRYQLATPIDRLNSPLPLTKFDTSVTLPNGVRSSEYVKRVSDEVTIKGSESWSAYPDSQTNVLGFYLSGALPLAVSTGTKSSYSCNDPYESLKTDTDIGNGGVTSVNYEAIYKAFGDVIKITVSKTKVSNLATFKTWLSQNPIKIRYQLATPIDNFNVPTRRSLIDLSSETGKNLFDVRDFVARANDTNIKIERVDGRDVLTLTGAPAMNGKPIFPEGFKFKENTRYAFRTFVKSGTAGQIGGLFKIDYTDGAIEWVFGTNSTTWALGSHVSVAGKTILKIESTYNMNAIANYYDLATLSITEGSAVPDHHLPPAKASALPIGLANTQTDGLTKRAIRSKKGMPFTYQNLVMNGDFAEGTTGFIGDGVGVLSVTGNECSTTGNGNDNYAVVRQTLPIGLFSAMTGKRYYASTYITSVDAATSIMLQIRTSSLLEFASISNPVPGKEYFLSGIVTGSGEFATPYFRSITTYTNAASAIGKISKIKKMNLINLTDNPFVQAVEAKLGRQITVEECDAIFEFTRSTKTVKVALQEFFKLDGVDSRFALSHPKLNIRGLEDFVMGVVFMTPAVLKEQDFIGQGLNFYSTIAFNMGISSTLAFRSVIAGNGYASKNVLLPHTLYRAVVSRIMGYLTITINEVEEYAAPNFVFITPQAFTAVGARSSSVDGSSYALFSDVYLGPIMLFKGADLKTGLSGILSRIEVAFEGYTPDESVSETDVLGVKWGKVSSPAMTRTDGALGKVVAVGGQNDFASHPIFSQIKEVTDKYGNVFVRFPKFYIKKTSVPGELTKQISLTKRPGYYLPWCFYDFETRRELPYFDVGKHIGSLSEDGLRLESKGGRFPANSKNIVQFRDLAKASGQGYQQLDVHGVDVLQTLFYMMFATLNAQTIMQGYSSGQYLATHVAVVAGTNVNQIVIANAFANEYRVGQAIGIGTSLGGNQIAGDRLVTAINIYDASNKAVVFDGNPINIAIGNIVYNTSYKTGWSAPLQTGWKEANDGKSPCAFLGIESPYGDLWQFVDGININERQSWVCKNAESYASNLFAAPYEQLGYVNGNVDSYVTEMGYDVNLPFAEITKMAAGGSQATFYSDYYYQANGQRVSRFGGYWGGTLLSGISYWRLDYASSSADKLIGARLCRKAVSADLKAVEDIQSYLDDASCKVAISIDRQVRSLQNANAPLQAVLADQAGRAGKNLFDLMTPYTTLSETTFSYISSGIRVQNSVLSASYKYATLEQRGLTPNVQMSISCKALVVAGGAFLTIRTSTDSIIMQAGVGATTTKFTFTVPSDGIVRFRFHSVTGASVAGDVSYTEIQLELGAAATAYEPYGFNNALLQGVAGTAADGYVLKAVKAASGDLVEYENLVTNGDFANTTGWGITGASINAVNNEIIGTGLGTANQPNLIGGNNGGTFVNGTRLNMSCRVSIPTGCTQIQLAFRDTTSNHTITLQTLVPSVYDTFIKLNANVTLPSASLFPRFQVIFTFPDSATANGKVMKIKEAKMVNLTDNPHVQRLEAKLGRQLTADECDYLFAFTPSTAQFYAKLAWFLKFNGTTALALMQSMVETNIVGTHDFSINMVFMTPPTITTQYVFFKGGNGSDIAQHHLVLYIAPYFGLRMNGVDVGAGTTMLPNALYEIQIARVGGSLSYKVAKVLTHSEANNTAISSSTNIRIAARTINAEGTTHANNSNIFLGALSISYNGAAGLDIIKVERAAAKLNEPYL